VISSVRFRSSGSTVATILMDAGWRAITGDTRMVTTSLPVNGVPAAVMQAQRRTTTIAGLRIITPLREG
jgi:hypothetical protein